MLLCVGFSSENKAYAFEAETNVYPYTANNVRFRFIELENGQKITSYDEYLSPETDAYFPNMSNYYYLNNPALDNVAAFAVTASKADTAVVFPYMPQVYDYYIIGSMIGEVFSGDRTSSTWKPTRMRAFGYDADNVDVLEYPILDERYYNFDSDKYRGFSWWAKIGFEAVGSSSIRGFELDSDIHGTGAKPGYQILQIAIVAVPKNANDGEVLEMILEKLVQGEENILESIGGVQDAVSEASKELQETIENQYAVEEDEDLDIDDMTQDLEEKMGLLSFSGDVLGDFVGLFDEANATDPVLTFPGFGMEVQGEMYQVWDSYDYDLRDLEEQFPTLIDAVRLISGLLIWLLLFNYIAKVADEFLRS